MINFRQPTIERFISGLLTCFFVLLISGSSAYAQSLNSDDANSIYGDTVWYKPSIGGISSSVCLGSGTLPAVVPDPYNSIFTAAANKYGVPPSFLAALFYAGEHGSSWPNPPTPYGTGSAWASSGVTSPGAPDWPTQPPGPGAAGPFQFEYPTWQKYGIDGNGDGTMDVEDLTDASFGAANYLSALGAATTDTNKLHDAARSYNGSGPQAEAYANSVMNAYQSFNNGGQTSSGTGTFTCPAGVSSAGLTNPFPGGWIPNRLDMGYDGTFKGQIVAPFSGTIIYAGIFNGWKNSYGVIIKSSSSLGSGVPTDTLYFTEGVYPLVTSGQQVSVGTPIAKAYPSPYGDNYGTTTDALGQIEWGVAQSGPIGFQTDTYAIALGMNTKKSCSPSPQSRTMVLNFYQWAQQSLQVPGNTTNPTCAGGT